MTMAPSTSCPHCGAVNPTGAAFCESCGKALPAGAPAMPRVVGSEGFATTSAGQQLQADQLHKQAKRASGALLAVAIITTIVGVVVFLVVRTRTGGGGGGGTGNSQFDAMMSQGAAVIMMILAAVFWGLYFWSRSQPLPAAIVGLVIYATLIAVNVISRVSEMSAGGPPTGGLGVGCLDIIIIVVLAQAISAGVKHRKLMRQQAQGVFPS